jgi:hypothetical protein
MGHQAAAGEKSDHCSDTPYVIRAAADADACAIGYCSPHASAAYYRMDDGTGIAPDSA